MKVIDVGSGIRVVIDNTYVIPKGETLVETRNNFLDIMGSVFDEAIYSSLTEDKMEDYSHIPNTVVMQMQMLEKPNVTLENAIINLDNLKQ